MIIRDALPSDARGIAEIHVDSWRKTYRGIVPDEYLAAMSHDTNEARHRNYLTTPHPETWTVVAVDDAGAINGFANFGRVREEMWELDGEVYAIYLQPGTERRGTGRALMAACARRLRENGFGSMLVWVLAENRSRYFYERCGGLPVTSKHISIGGAILEEIGYGWKDLTVPWGSGE
ncbi:MAG: GNAT family N-acetyltransferase [Candidatus Kapaibacterium sp.]